jgi:hypothetical protein
MEAISTISKGQQKKWQWIFIPEVSCSFKNPEIGVCVGRCLAKWVEKRKWMKTSLYMQFVYTKLTQIWIYGKVHEIFRVLRKADERAGERGKLFSVFLYC